MGKYFVDGKKRVRKRYDLQSAFADAGINIKKSDSVYHQTDASG